jgi:HSP90 family molecular chaperone
VREAEGALNPQMRRMMKMMGQEENLGEVPKPDFELNPDHALITRLESLRHSDADLAKQVGGQLLDSALAAAGLMDDPRAMLGRLNVLLERLLPTPQPEREKRNEGRPRAASKCQRIQARRGNPDFCRFV